MNAKTKALNISKYECKDIHHMKYQLCSTQCFVSPPHKDPSNIHPSTVSHSQPAKKEQFICSNKLFSGYSIYSKQTSKVSQHITILFSLLTDGPIVIDP